MIRIDICVQMLMSRFFLPSQFFYVPVLPDQIVSLRSQCPISFKPNALIYAVYH